MAVAHTNGIGVVLGRRWRPPAVDLQLLAWLTGDAFVVAPLPPAARRFKIETGAAVPVLGIMMVAKTRHSAVIVSADHAIVRVDGRVFAVAANKPLVLPAPGVVAAIAVRHGGCRLHVVPASDVAALLDSSAATNVCYRSAAAFPGFVEAVLVDGPHWLCPGCGDRHRHLDAMWAHLGAPGRPPQSLQPLMPSPPLFGSPMTAFAENTVATSVALNQRLHARLHAIAPAGHRHHGSGGGRDQHPAAPDCRGDVVANAAGRGRDRRGDQSGGGDRGHSYAGRRRQHHERNARGGHGPSRGGGGFRGTSRHQGGGGAGGGNHRRDGGNRPGAGPVASHYHGHGHHRHHDAVNRHGNHHGHRAGGGSTGAWRSSHQQQRGGGGRRSRDERAGGGRCRNKY